MKEKENIDNIQNNENKPKKEKKINLKEMWHDKRGKAKIELSLYLIFFLGVIIFARVLGSMSAPESQVEDTFAFINTIKDNYEYDILVNYNEDNYHYYGKRLGNNTNITREDNDSTLTNYYKKTDKYYALEEDNYLLTTEEEIFPKLSYKYLNINTIKAYLSISTKVEGTSTYQVKVSDLILNSPSSEYIEITPNKEETSITIDYTSLFKEKEEEISKVTVKLTYQNIDKITTLE